MGLESEVIWAWCAALCGGALIGSAALILLSLNGRILGVSGIVGGLFQKNSERKGWRLAFVLGILFGGLFAYIFFPQQFQISIYRTPLVLIAAGLLVGFGSRMGGGCTSGHGVCGISRLSKRSVVATIVFMLFGALSVYFINHVMGGYL